MASDHAHWGGLHMALEIVVDARRAAAGPLAHAVRDALFGVEERIRPMIPHGFDPLASPPADEGAAREALRSLESKVSAWFNGGDLPQDLDVEIMAARAALASPAPRDEARDALMRHYERTLHSIATTRGSASKLQRIALDALGLARAADLVSSPANDKENCNG